MSWIAIATKCPRGSRVVASVEFVAASPVTTSVEPERAIVRDAEPLLNVSDDAVHAVMYGEAGLEDGVMATV